MGMSIKEAIPILHDMYNYYNDTDIDAYIGFDKEDNNAIETALDTMRKYQMMQADYENRLKADLEAILVELQLEIEELQGKYTPYYDEASQHTSQLIQQKIDALKEVVEDGSDTSS